MIHTVIPIKYDAEPNKDFQSTLKRRVNEYLKTQPAGARATPFMWFKVAFFIAAYFVVLGELTLVRHTLGVTAGLILLFSMITVGVAYNIAHDAVHGALSKRGWVNELLFYVPFNVFGPNAYLWRYRHTVMHHSAVNVPGYDFNIEAADVLRFSPTQRWRPVHRFQHLYAPLLYLVFTFHWVFVKDFKMLHLERIGNVSGIKHPKRRVAELLAWKILHVGVLIVLPCFTLGVPVWQVLLGYLFYQALGSFQFVLTFTGSHLNRGMVFIDPKKGLEIPHSFFEHAIRTSLDFHPTNPFLSFWLGGFNAHVAHHMFPHVCSVHYPEISRIIQETAAEFDMPYQQMAIHELVLGHFAYLRDLGMSPTGPVAAYMYPPPAEALDVTPDDGARSGVRASVSALRVAASDS